MFLTNNNIMPQSEISHQLPRDRFINIWLTQPSWSPIHRTSEGWITAKTASGKQVPLTYAAIQRAYRKGQIIGRRHSKETSYLMIDLDMGSEYHPMQRSFDAIASVLEELGLCRYITIQSSDSGGLHLYYPLPESMNSWAIASTVHAKLTEAGVNVAAGQCELFPNKKGYDSDYNGHRLPLQDGSFILDDDFQPVSESKDEFVEQWEAAAASQDAETLQECFSHATATPASEIPLAWTGPGQSNKIMMKLGKLGAAEGFANVADLAAWIKAKVRSLPGFSEWCSRRSKRDIEKSWATRIATWVMKAKRIGRVLVKKLASTHNDDVAAEALNRIKAAMSELEPSPDWGIANLWRTISKTSLSLFGVGVSWGTFQKHRSLILEVMLGEEDSTPSKNAIHPHDTQSQQQSQPSRPPINHLKEVVKCHSAQLLSSEIEVNSLAQSSLSISLPLKSGRFVAIA